jgi:hypothetical protein
MQLIAGPPTTVSGTTYNSDGTQEFDAGFAQCDSNGVRSPDGDVYFVFDTDYGYSNGSTTTGPFKVRYRGSYEPVDLVITPAIAAKSAAYCSVDEFKSLKKRMKIARASRILDGKGRRVSRGGVTETRTYGKTSTTSGDVQYCTVTLRAGLLLSKDRTSY